MEKKDIFGILLNLFESEVINEYKVENNSIIISIDNQVVKISVVEGEDINISKFDRFLMSMGVSEKNDNIEKYRRKRNIKLTLKNIYELKAYIDMRLEQVLKVEVKYGLVRLEKEKQIKYDILYSSIEIFNNFSTGVFK